MGLVMSDLKKKVEELDLNDILPNRFQPRIKFNEEKIFELSQSIKEHGVLQPIIVRPIGDKYEIVTGERRYKASVLAGLKTIPSLVLNIEDKDSIEVALIENVQREDLSPIEEAISYKKILDMGYLTQEELADKLGISQSAIANKKRLLNLCDDVQEALMEKDISERHARSLLKITDLEVQKNMLYRIVSEKLTVRQLDLEINKVLEDPDYIKSLKEKDSDNPEEIKNENVTEETSPIEKNDEDNNEKINDISEVKEEANEDKINFDDILNDIIKSNDDDSETIDVNNIELEDSSDDQEDKNITLIEEKEENGENDKMNNMMNLDEEVNYNSLKNSSGSTGGKFIGVNVDDSEEKVEKTPVVENKSFFDFSTGTVREDANNNVTITRNSDYVDNSKDGLNIFGAKMSDLLTTKSDKPTLDDDIDNEPEKETSNNFINTDLSAEVNAKPSIFANLMKKEEDSTSSIDNDTLQSFLDPSFINGEKQESSADNDSKINDSIFSKFIDEDFGGEITPSVSDDSNDLLANTLFGNKENIDNNNSNSTTLPELLSINTNDTDSSDDNGGVSNSMFDEVKLDNSESENKEDNTPVEVIPDLMAVPSKPDLLAPMKEDKKEEVSPVIETPVLDNTNLVPDSSLLENNEDENNEEEEEPATISETIEKPVFITASSDDINLSAPTTPIITDTKMSNLLSIEPEKDKTEEVEDTKEETITEEVVPAKEEEEVKTPITNSNIDIQPIIITDYNKQYDPILPVTEEIKEPVIDFKQILSMIRDLSNKIEEYGYKIDTDEIDLENSYQVIFNIEKK